MWKNRNYTKEKQLGESPSQIGSSLTGGVTRGLTISTVQLEAINVDEDVGLE